MSSSTQCSGQPVSSSERRITDCSAASGVEIMPPQRSTRATGSDDTHLTQVPITNYNWR